MKVGKRQRYGWGKSDVSRGCQKRNKELYSENHERAREMSAPFPGLEIGIIFP